MDADPIVFFSGAFFYLIVGCTPVPMLSFGAIMMLFKGEEKFHEKLLMLLGGTPIWGLYLIMVSGALDQWILRENPLTCITWLACLHWVYIYGFFSPQK